MKYLLNSGDAKMKVIVFRALNATIIVYLISLYSFNLLAKHLEREMQRWNSGANAFISILYDFFGPRTKKIIHGGTFCRDFNLATFFSDFAILDYRVSQFLGDILI